MSQVIAQTRKEDRLSKIIGSDKRTGDHCDLLAADHQPLDGSRSVQEKG
jgi:hypothetical protein